MPLTMSSPTPIQDKQNNRKKWLSLYKKSCQTCYSICGEERVGGWLGVGGGGSRVIVQSARLITHHQQSLQTLDSIMQSGMLDSSKETTQLINLLPVVKILTICISLCFPLSGKLNLVQFRGMYLFGQTLPFLWMRTDPHLMLYPHL